MLTRLRSMLLADGVLTAEDLAAADASRQALKSDLATELLLSRRLNEAQLTRYLGRACGLPTVGPDDFCAVVPGVLGRLPLHRSRQLSAVPFHEDARDLRVAVSSPLPEMERQSGAAVCDAGVPNRTGTPPAARRAAACQSGCGTGDNG
jgi:hypothetical protein